MTISTATLYEQRIDVPYSQLNVNDSSGNFSAVASTTQAVSGSSGVTTAITLTGANAAILIGMVVTGTSIPAGTIVQSISGVNLILSQPTTGNAGSLTFALTGKVVRVWRWDLYVAGGADLTFNSVSSIPVTTPIYGPVGYGGSIVQALVRDLPTVKVPWFQTLPGDLLNITLGSAVRASGTVLVSIETPSP